MDIEISKPVMGDSVLDIVREQKVSEEEQAKLDAKLVESIDDDFSLFSWDGPRH